MAQPAATPAAGVAAAGCHLADSTDGKDLYAVAADQYISEFRFSIRHQMALKMETTAAMPEASTGMAAAMAVITNLQMVVQYLKSTQIIEDMIAAGVDLDAIYTGSDRDLWAHLRRDASLEERQRYWKSMVDPFFDLSNGIVSVEVRAFRPADAQLVARTALALCEKLLNDISVRTHADSLAYAEKAVVEANAKMRATQIEKAAYRNLHAVLFPEMQATAESTTEATVQQALIDAKTAYATQLAQGVAKDTTQMNMLQHRITALKSELQDLHGHLARTGAGELLASVLAEYNQLQAFEQNAGKMYDRSLTLLLDARNEASQQSVYRRLCPARAATGTAVPYTLAADPGNRPSLLRRLVLAAIDLSWNPRSY